MNLVLYILIAAAPFVVINGLWDYANLPKEIFLRNGVLLLAVVFFWKHRRKDIAFSGLAIAYSIFLCWAALSLLWATNRFESMVTLSHWLMCGLLFVMVRNMAGINRTTVFSIIFATAGIVALFGVGQHYLDLNWITQTGQESSTFGNCNMAGRYVVMALPLGVFLLYSIKVWRFRVPLAALFVPMLVYIYVITFKTGMLVIVMAGAYFLVRYCPKTIKIGAVACLIALIAATMYTHPNFLRQSKPDRLEIWKNTTEISYHHPWLGVGLGNFKVHYDRYSPDINVNDAHNDYLQILCELGIVGMCAAIGIGIVGFRSFYRLRDAYSLALKTGLCIFLIVAFFSFPLERAVTPFIASLYAGLLRA